MLVTVLATLAFLVLLIWKAKKDILEYQVLCLITYLTAFLFLQEFGILLVLYEIFSVFPFLARCRLNGKILLFLMLVAVWGFVSILEVGLVSFSEIFFTRYFFLLSILLLLGCSSDVSIWKTCNVNRAFWEAVIAEACFMGYLLIVNRTSVDVFVVNHQPVVGNMSICAVLLAARLTHDRTASASDDSGRASIAARVLFCMLACVASGIRGYIILIVPVGLYVLCALIGSRKGRLAFVLLSVAAMAMLLCAYSAFAEGGIKGLVADVDMGIGYRENENQFFMESLMTGDFVGVLLGHGIGVTGGQVSLSAVHAAATSPFLELHLLETNTLLNIWELYVLNVGLLGALAICVVIFELVRHVYSRLADPVLKRTIMLYVAAYVVMLAFRNSVSCGVSEFLVLGIVACMVQERDHGNSGHCKHRY